jgi:hypothetical protein
MAGGRVSPAGGSNAGSISCQSTPVFCSGRWSATTQPPIGSVRRYRLRQRQAAGGASPEAPIVAPGVSSRPIVSRVAGPNQTGKAPAYSRRSGLP